MRLGFVGFQGFCSRNELDGAPGKSLRAPEIWRTRSASTPTPSGSKSKFTHPTLGASARGTQATHARGRQPARTHRLSDMSTATCSWPFRQPVPQFQSHQRDLEATVTSDAAARQMNRTPRCVEDRAIAERCLSAVVRRRPCEVSGTKSVLPQIQCVLDVKPLKGTPAERSVTRSLSFYSPLTFSYPGIATESALREVSSNEQRMVDLLRFRSSRIASMIRVPALPSHFSGA